MKGLHNKFKFMYNLQRVLTPKAQLQIDLQCNLFTLEF